MFERDLKALECLNVQHDFVSHVYDGDTLAEACAFMRINPAALALARREMPKFDEAIRDAQAFRVDVLVDRLENISAYEEDSQMAGVVSKNIQWLAARRLRAIYGDKLDVNHNVTIDIKGAIEAARNRVLVDVTPNTLIENNNATDKTSAAQAPVIIDADEIDPLS